MNPEEIKYTLPIEHLSYSALRLYCANRQQFKKNYIEGRWDRFKESMTALVGTGVHKVLELYFDGMPIEQAIAKGHDEINAIPAGKLDFTADGKTRQKLLDEMSKAVKFVLEELPDVGQVLKTEMSELVDLVIEGELQPLPVKGKIDMVTKLEDGLHIWDWKVVSAFSIKEYDETLTEEENRVKLEKPDYIMQSIFNFYIVQSVLKEAPKKMHFVEIKKSENRDKTQRQIQIYEIDFTKHPEYFKYFKFIYDAFVYELAGLGVQFLPNFGDMYSGQESWYEFTQEYALKGEIDFKLPELVSHKSPMQHVLTPKRYIESQTDSIVSRELTPEEQIMAKLQEFGIPMKHENTYASANVTLYTFKPSKGVTMAKIKQYESDVMIGLGAESVRIIAPIKGTKTVGIEVSNEKQSAIVLTEKHYSESLNIPIGVDVYGKTRHVNLVKAPHLLVAGATGAGKSVFLNVLIHSLAQQNDTDHLQLILVDPKRTEFSQFEGLPHLMADVLTEVEQIQGTFEWLRNEMDVRYTTLQKAKVRNIDEYNEKVGLMPKIVVVVDEYADLVLSPDKVAASNIKNDLIRLAQKARAAGIHLVVATQRPSVNVVDGILKANFPTRIAFMVATGTDSQVILDDYGAERLIGNGDCLLKAPSLKEMVRLQAFYKE